MTILWLGSLVFAPVAVLMPYATIEEAIDIANDTRYGLGASVFGPDQDECLKIAKRLECGMVSINDFGTFYVSFSLSRLLSSKLFTINFIDEVS